jgi:hypothetical protein
MSLRQVIRDGLVLVRALEGLLKVLIVHVLEGLSPAPSRIVSGRSTSEAERPPGPFALYPVYGMVEWKG